MTLRGLRIGLTPLFGVGAPVLPIMLKVDVIETPAISISIDGA